MRSALIAYFLFSLSLSLLQTARAQSSDSTGDCAALVKADFSFIPDAPTQVISSIFVEATGDMPAYCKVRGYVSPRVGIELRLPQSTWNGKFWKVGNGGSGGRINGFSCINHVRRGYACLASDMGHTSTSQDNKWAYNNIQAEIDFGYRATHVATLAGKAITEHFYGGPPRYSYFSGCSTGGRQGLIEAQKFPWDFDGIIAGAPPIDWSSIVVRNTWASLSNEVADDQYILAPADLDLVHGAVLEQCDMLDGAKDGIIGNPLACDFDPSVLRCQAQDEGSCLSESQVEFMIELYVGPKDENGQTILAGSVVPGGEPQLINFISFQPGDAPQNPGDFWRYLAFWPDPGSTWNIADFDLVRDYKRMGLMNSINSATNPDLRRFKQEGHKLLMWSGWNDFAIPAYEMIDYAETVERTMGGREQTQDFFRLFMLPGVSHCLFGPGAYAFDHDRAIEAWVEDDRPPDRLIAHHIKPEAFKNYPTGLRFPLSPEDVKFSRPVYPFPITVRYAGPGSVQDAAN